ncbi:hypothetical protein Tco_0919978, partial [Tanacetum coccineum]
LASAAICKNGGVTDLVSRAYVIENKVKTLTITTFLFPSKKVLCAAIFSGMVWISQKSQENNQKRANTDTRIKKSTKPKPKEYKAEAKRVQSLSPFPFITSPRAILAFREINQQPKLSQPDSDLIVLVFRKGDDPIDAINHMMSFLSAVVMPSSEQSNVVTHSETKINNALILSVIEQLKTQVVNYTKINLDNKSVNDTLTDELKRYKEQVKVLKEGQNVDLRSNDTVLDLSAQSIGIDRLKQTLSEHLKEKESLMQTVTLLKNDFKKEESRNIDREIALEKKIKQLYNILEPKLYDGNVIMNTSAIVIPDSEETLMLAEEVNSINTSDPTPSNRPTKVEVPKALPKVSMVNTSLKKLKHHLAGFDVVVKERTTSTSITKGLWGFEHTKACFRDEIIVKALKDLFNTFDQYLIDELSEVQNVFHQMEQAVEQHHLESKTFEVTMNQVLNENK